MKRDHKEQQTVLIPVHVCALSIPITLANISHLQMAELEHNKVPVPPDHTRSLSVFLAWRVHKSLAQVHTQAVAHSEQSHPAPKPLAFVQLTKKHKALVFTYSFSQSLSRKDVKRDTA